MVKIIKLEDSKEYPGKDVIKISDTNGRFEEVWFEEVDKKDSLEIIAKLVGGQKYG